MRIWTNIGSGALLAGMFVAVVFELLLAPWAGAQDGVVPQRIPYHAMLPGVSGAHGIEVQLYDALEDGTLIWNKAFADVAVVNEHFAVVLAGVSDSDAGVSIVDAFADPERYVEILVDGVSTGARQRLASAPYAVVARNFVPDDSGNETFSFIPNATTIRLTDPLDRRDFGNPDDVNTVLAAQVAGFTLRSGSLLQITFQCFSEQSQDSNSQSIAVMSTVATFVVDRVGGTQPPIVVEQPIAAGPAQLESAAPTYYWNNETLYGDWIGAAFNEIASAEVDVSVFLTYQGPQLGDMYTQRSLTVQEVFQQNDGLRTTAPTADFSSNLGSGEPFPVTVQFTDESDPGSAPIVSWHWDFGDDRGFDLTSGEPLSMSTEQHPSHRYISPGEYTVTLRVQTIDGEDSETKEAFVVVEELK